MADPVAAIGTKAKCADCGKTVWFRKVGVMGYTGHHPRQPVFQWCARKVWWTESYFDVRDAEHAIILLAEALGMRSPFIGTTPAIAPHHMLVEADTEEDPVVERLPIMRVEVGP